MNTRERVCPRCLDKPFIFNRPLIIPPDPVPRIDPRPENFARLDQGTYPLPPLPWPVQPVGPVNPDAPRPPQFAVPQVEPYLPPALPPPFVPPAIKSEP